MRSSKTCSYLWECFLFGEKTRFWIFLVFFDRHELKRVLVCLRAENWTQSTDHNRHSNENVTDHGTLWKWSWQTLMDCIAPASVASRIVSHILKHHHNNNIHRVSHFNPKRIRLTAFDLEYYKYTRKDQEYFCLQFHGDNILFMNKIFQTYYQKRACLSSEFLQLNSITINFQKMVVLYVGRTSVFLVKTNIIAIICLRDLLDT